MRVDIQIKRSILHIKELQLIFWVFFSSINRSGNYFNDLLNNPLVNKIKQIQIQKCFTISPKVLSLNFFFCHQQSDDPLFTVINDKKKHRILRFNKLGSIKQLIVVSLPNIQPQISQQPLNWTQNLSLSERSINRSIYFVPSACVHRRVFNWQVAGLCWLGTNGS